MRKPLSTAAIAAALTVIPASAAFATTPPSDPNDVPAVDNPVDENDDSGFDDWGLLGLLGLAGLAGLAGLKRRDDRVSHHGHQPNPLTGNPADRAGRKWVSTPILPEPSQRDREHTRWLRSRRYRHPRLGEAYR